jgi:peptidoglycan glycosyltransferase
MAPHTVSSIQGQNLSTVDTTSPDRLSRAFSSTTADTLTQLMIGAENNASSTGKIPGVQLASKTGTAEQGANPKTDPPHTWYDAFGPVPNPSIAVSVIVERGGDRGDDATGSSVAAPVGRAVIAAALQGAR